MAEQTTVRFNIKIPVTLHREFKAACAKAGETQTDVVLRMMQQYIDEQGPVQKK
jgi:hypothetical protein